MISRYDAVLNGVSLSSLHPQILITDISYPEPNRSFNTITTAKRLGARIQDLGKDKASVSIQFMVRAYDTRERQRICQDVCQWAKNGGELTVSDRENQKLVCVCEKLPSVQSVRNWLDTLEIGFSAYAVPYWQDIAESRITIGDGLTANGSFYVPGNAPEALVSATITANEPLTAISVGIDDTLMSIHDIDIAQDGVIEIGYSPDMILHIMYGTTSLLANRFGADDLVAKCGQHNRIAFTANADCTVTYKARGWWE